jgi:hypothetical protein
MIFVHSQANNNLAVIYSMQGKVNQATALLETAIKNNPTYGKYVPLPF